MAFTKQIAITYPECGIDGLLKLSGILRHGQEVVGEHLENLGINYYDMLREGQVFLLVRTSIAVVRSPAALEKITLWTEPHQSVGARFTRETAFIDSAGQKIVTGYGCWLLADPHTRRILRPDAFTKEIGITKSGYAEKFARERVKPYPQAQPAFRKIVRYSDLDSNLHMNNCVYGDIVCDALPFEEIKGRKLERFDISYVKEALPGDELEVSAEKLSDGTYYVGAHIAGARCFDSYIKFKS